MIRLYVRRADLVRYRLPAVIWSALILISSGEAGSATISGPWLGVLIESMAGPLEPDIFRLTHFLVRKAAHVLVYGVLSLLSFRAFRAGRAGWKGQWAISAVGWAAAVAAADELHQSFVPRRDGTLSDFVLDVAAAAAVQGIWMLFSTGMKRPMLLALLLVSVRLDASQPTEKYELLSPVYTIEKKYRSMEGPGHTQQIFLGDRTTPELVWLVGVKTEMVSEDGETPQLPELMCHVNVDLDQKAHRALFNIKRFIGERVITLSQGVTEARLPEGFGFPLSSSEPLNVFTQVLNHNIEKPENMKVRHRVTFEYVRDRDLIEPMKPLLNVGASGMVFLDSGALAASAPAGDHSGGHGEGTSGSCLMASRAPNAAGMNSDYIDPKGRKLTGHWVVPPGRQVNHTDVTWFMSLPFDASLHYAAVHLHPFAESLALRDVTADKTIFIARAINPEGKIGLDHVDAFVSRPGVQLYRDHKYELISVYHNPTQETHDSMASVFLGVGNGEFVKPAPDELAVRTMELEESNLPAKILVETSLGAFGIDLLREEAPRAAKQFVRLALRGQLAGARVTRIEKDGDATLIMFAAPLTAERKRLIQPLPVERGAKHDRGTISLCPTEGDAEVRFEIVVGRLAKRDGVCTAFGQITAGAGLILQLASAQRDENGAPLTPVEIKNANAFQ
jgi:VanZ family protein/cyclophilin family peptidyl-prolyl cis-trans isomerase